MGWNAAPSDQDQGHGERPRQRATPLIAYFETSAFLKLLIDEPGSAAVRRFSVPWVQSVCSLILYPEARAALAAARRARRIGGGDYGQALELLEQLWRRSNRLRVTAALVRRAGDLAEQHALRGYDAVHLASFETIASDATLLVTFDADLRRAARAIGFTVAPAAA